MKNSRMLNHRGLTTITAMAAAKTAESSQADPATTFFDLSSCRVRPLFFTKLCLRKPSSILARTVMTMKAGTPSLSLVRSSVR